MSRNRLRLKEISRIGSVPLKSLSLENLPFYFNEHHRFVGYRKREALYHAKLSGEGLIEARKRLPYGEWKQWLQDHFQGSYETSKVYRRIAKRWNDPRIREAKKNGFEPTSIAGFLELIKTPLSPADRKDDKAEAKIREQELEVQDKIKKQLSVSRRHFAIFSGYLHPAEVATFNEAFWSWWLDTYPLIYKATCSRLGYDLNEALLEDGELDKKPRGYYGLPKEEQEQIDDREALQESEKYPNRETRRKWVEKRKLRRQRLRKGIHPIIGLNKAS